MKYDEALEYMKNRINPLGSVPGLDTTRELLKRIGNPEKELKIIHIAGTNGKGSVSAFLDGILRANGYRTGRYLSPSVVDYREKIQVNGQFIPKTKVSEYLTALYEQADEMVKDGFPHPTSFEIETAMAFWYLKDKKCDFAVIETGMGGKDDSTNVIPSPLVCVFTSVSEDHLGIIGNTVEEIALTKSGIIKDGTTVVVAPQKESILKVFTDAAAEHRDVDVRVIRREDIVIPVKAGKVKLPGMQKFSYKNYKNIQISLLGEYQPENAAVALEAAEVLMAKGVRLNEEKTRKGLKETLWPARFEILGKKPPVIADGAHNPDGVAHLMKTMDGYFTNVPIIYIMGVLKDKAVDEMIHLSAAKAMHIITVTPPDNPRGMSAFELAQKIKEVNPSVSAADSVEEALEEACLMAGPDGVILAFGSLSYMGKLREAYKLHA